MFVPNQCSIPPRQQRNVAIQVMKRVVTLLCFFAACVSAKADGIQKCTSPNETVFAAARSVPEQELFWKPELDSTRLAIYKLKDDSLKSLLGDFYFPNLLLNKMEWSPDSNFLVFTMGRSSGS